MSEVNALHDLVKKWSINNDEWTYIDAKIKTIGLTQKDEADAWQ